MEALAGLSVVVKKGVALLAVAALIAGAVAWIRPERAEAHCDSVGGPVVTAARQALETGNVRLILPYVPAEAEAELTAAFRQAMEVRQYGGKARELAERYFFETAVRLHRAGEGAPYTGLKEEAIHHPALEAAEKALATGSLDEVNEILLEAVRHGVEEKYHGVIAAREAAAREGTVAADRERVEAELVFEKYVYDLYQLAVAYDPHASAEGTRAPGHAHEH